MASAPSNHDYLLAVTAGPDYHDQKPVQVNSEKQLHIESELCTADLLVRIQNYRGDDAAAQKSSPYFSDAAHTHDLYSLSFTFTPKEDINGYDLVFGNDFDHPVRDKLPPGFQQAFNIVKWFIDPGLYGDVHADEPYLYGPMLSSINTFRVGSRDDREHESVVEQRANGDVWIVHEGGDGEGKEARSSQGVPDDAAARKKYFLTEQHLKDFTFEKDREYSCDFFNPYLDFNDFALRLPGFSLIPGITIPIIRYWDGQPLRYVLKKRSTGETLFVVVFTLVPKAGKSEQGATTPPAKKSAVEEPNEDDVD